MTAPPPVTRVRLDSLTGLRFAAALVVFFYHAGYYLPAGELDVFSAGMTGVSLFYILSGFVMAWVLRSDDRPGLFYRRRFARIYPAYFFAVTASIGVSLIMRDFSITELSAYTLLQAWHPDPTVHFAASPVFWSLSCEAFFYIVFPFIASRLSRLSSRSLWIAVALAIAVVMLIGITSSFFWEQEFVRWATYIFPVSRLPEFVLGIALGLLVRRGYRAPVSVGGSSCLALVAVVGASLTPGGLKIAAITVLPFAVLVLSLASRDATGGRSWFSWPVMVELGVWSYCFYLLHAMLQGWSVRGLALAGLPALPGLGVSLIVSVAGAWLLHTIVERPFEKGLRPKASAPRLDTD
jgi:peptidoglycan/LPS O-acetylase OafA/YrhL